MYRLVFADFMNRIDYRIYDYNLLWYSIKLQSKLNGIESVVRVVLEQFLSDF